MKISKALRGNRDLPQVESINLNALAGAGSGSDYEHVIVALPNLRQNAPAGTAGMYADNTMQIRWCMLTWEANLTGANTNNVTIQFNQRRGGNFLVNTTSSTTVTAGSLATITVGAGAAANCYIGQSLSVSGGTGTPETVVVTAYNPVLNTITAYFVNAHSGTYNVVAAPLATITYASGTNDSAWITRQLVPVQNTIKPGDVITVQRISNGTGLATPAVTVGVEWVEGGPQ